MTTHIAYRVSAHSFMLVHDDGTLHFYNTSSQSEWSSFTYKSLKGTVTKIASLTVWLEIVELFW